MPSRFGYVRDDPWGWLWSCGGKVRKRQYPRASVSEKIPPSDVPGEMDTEPSTDVWWERIVAVRSFEGISVSCTRWKP